MPLVLQLHLVMISKYSKSGVDNFNTFWVMGYFKVFAQWQWRRSNDHNSSTFSLEQTSKIALHKYSFVKLTINPLIFNKNCISNLFYIYTLITLYKYQNKTLNKNVFIGTNITYLLKILYIEGWEQNRSKCM